MNPTRILAIFALMTSTLTVAWPAATAQAEAAWVESDAAGDVFVFGQPAPAAAPNPATAPFDLVKLGIVDEDEIGIGFYLQVADFNGGANTGIFTTGEYYLEFELEGTNIAYAVGWYPVLPDPTVAKTGIEPVYAQFCVYEKAEDGEIGGGRGGCIPQRFDATVDWDANRLYAYVTKDALMGRAPLDTGFALNQPPTVTLGSRLSGFGASYEQFFPVPASDRLPDVDTVSRPYVMTSASANLDIRIVLDQDKDEEGQVEVREVGPGGAPTIQEGVTTDVSVTPGVASLVPLRIENDNDAKRLINLTVEFDDPAEKSGWELQIVPSIQVPGGDDRVVNLVVNATSSLEHRTRASILVRGHSLGYADELAALRLNLVASVPPSTKSPTLYFHATDIPQDTLQGAICTVFFCGGFDQALWMNTLDQDPSATLDADGVDMEGFGFSTSGNEYELQFPLDTPLVHDLVLDVEKPVEAVLAFSPTSEFPARVELSILTADGNRYLAGGSDSVTIGSGSAVSLSFLPLADAGRVAVEEGGLVARLTVTAQAPAGAASNLGFRFVPGESSLTLPLIQDPTQSDAAVMLGPALITLSAPKGLEEFVNPGKTKILNVTILNEGIEADEVEIGVAYDAEGWQIVVLPASRFTLPPGDAAKFSILARAPEDAVEGDRVNIMANATSLKDPTVVAQIRFTVTVVTQIDLADESGYYRLDVESQDKIAGAPASNTPGFGALAAFGAVMGTLMIAGRRRREG